MSSVLDTYVKITMPNNGSPAQAVMAKDMPGLTGSVKSFEAHSNTLRDKMTVIGTAGDGLIDMFKNVNEHVKDLSHELTQIQNLGLTPVQVKAIQDQAVKVTHDVSGTGEVDALRMFGQSYSTFGYDNALKLMEPLSAFAKAAGNTSGDYEGAAHKIYEMVRAGDLMGKFINEQTHQVDIMQLQHFLDIGAKTLSSSNGTVDSAAWMGLAQQGGPALSNMSEQGLITMAIAGQAMGSQGAGKALTSLYQQMVGGKMTEHSAKELKRLGLVGGFEAGREGHILWNKGSLNTDFVRQLSTDPISAVEILKKAMEAHGMKSMDKMVPELFQILGRQTSQRLIHDLLQSLPQIEGTRTRTMGAMDVSGSDNIQDKQDLVQVEHNLAVAWNNLMLAVAGPNAETEITILNDLTGAIEWLRSAIEKTDPQTIVRIGEGVLGLGTAFAVGGAISMAIGMGGWLISGISALSTAFTGGAALVAALGPAGWLIAGVGALVALDFATGSHGLHLLEEAITGFMNAVTGFARWLNPDWQAIDPRAFGAPSFGSQVSSIPIPGWTMGKPGTDFITPTSTSTPLIPLPHFMTRSIFSSDYTLPPITPQSEIGKYIEGNIKSIGNLVPAPVPSFPPPAGSGPTPSAPQAPDAAGRGSGPGTPATVPQTITVPVTLNLDGRTLARAVATVLANGARTTNGADFSDKWSNWDGPGASR